MMFKYLAISLLLSASQAFSTVTKTDMPSAYLSNIPEGPPDAILGIAEAFKSCTDERKVNVCVGAYRDSSGKPWILPSVRKAEERLLADSTVNKEYAPIAGDAKYVELALGFAYGAQADMSNIAGVQSLSGTGACRIGGHFLSEFVPKPAGLDKVPIYIPNPTWGNHIAIFKTLVFHKTTSLNFVIINTFFDRCQQLPAWFYDAVLSSPCQAHIASPHVQ